MDAKQNSPFSKTFFEMVNLKYSRFVAMINELNSIAEYFLDDDGCSLSFRLVNGTDQSFLWKLTVRITASKVIQNLYFEMEKFITFFNLFFYTQVQRF